MALRMGAEQYYLLWVRDGFSVRTLYGAEIRLALKVVGLHTGDRLLLFRSCRDIYLRVFPGLGSVCWTARKRLAIEGRYSNSLSIAPGIILKALKRLSLPSNG